MAAASYWPLASGEATAEAEAEAAAVRAVVSGASRTGAPVVEKEVEVVNRYGDAMNANLFIARRGAVFAPTCTIHCYTGHWTQIAIDGVRMVDAIGSFFGASNPSGMLWYDTCRGGNCNPTCPISPIALQTL